MFPILGGAAQQLEAVPYLGPAPAHERRWRPTADRGLFELRTTGDRLPSGWVQLTLEIKGTLPAAPRLLIDDGQGFADAAALQLPLPRSGRVHAIVELPARVRQLVLEIGNASQVTLGTQLARELGTAEAALRLAMPILRRRLAEPWSIPIAALKLAQAVWNGEVLPGLSQKEIHEEPQLWYERWHRRYAELSEGDRAAIRNAAGRLVAQPLISVLLLASEASEKELERARASVQKQLYSRWESFVVEGTEGAANAARQKASGEYLLLLDARDELAEHALYLIAEEIGAHPGADVVFGDEDSVDAQGRLHDPIFKPDWNLDLFYSTNYLGRAFAARTARVAEVGGFRDGFGGSRGYDLLLRIVARTGAIRHVPFAIYHRRAGDDASAGAAGLRALQEHLGDGAVVEPGPFPATHRVRWRLPAPPPLVSLIIPTRDARYLLEPCVESLLSQTAYKNFELLIVDNGSREPDAIAYLEALEGRHAARVLRYPQPFNFSAINNFAVAQARGEVVGLLNNDLEFVEPHWLEEMVSQAMRPGVGAVGARLLYPDRTVQHAGVILGIGGLADHLHKSLPAEAPGYCGRARLTQNFSAVTAACLLVRRETYLKVLGFDETFAVAFNDVDFCLRLRERGLRNVWTPFATVIHHESKSRGREDTLAKAWRFRGEKKRLAARWGEALLADPAYNPNLTVKARNVSLAWPPRVRRPWR